MTLPDHYEPEEQAKVWYRSVMDGQLGWYVKREGKPYIKLDRPGPREMLKPFNKHNWNLCEDPRELSEHHIGEITFEADKVLCRILGKYDLSYRNWSMLPRPEKKTWIAFGPRDEPKRVILYRTIKQAMSKLDEKNRNKNTTE